METNTKNKPLGIKAYGSIAHLPGSRMGTGDHHCHEGQARIACEKARDRHDTVIVQEKLDGSCVSVARVGAIIIPLGRSGYTAESSPYEQHRMFHAWVMEQQDRFLAVLEDGERLVGEWLAQAHGTRYSLKHEPFVAFDIIRGHERLTHSEFVDRTMRKAFIQPKLLHIGSPLSITDAMQRMTPDYHGSLDPIEGAVWRVERRGRVDFLVKYVRPDKVDGCYLPNITKQPEVWNWKP